MNLLTCVPISGGPPHGLQIPDTSSGAFYTPSTRATPEESRAKLRSILSDVMDILDDDDAVFIDDIQAIDQTVSQ